MARVITLGTVVLDHVFGIPEFVGGGLKVTAGSYRAAGGGIAATAAVAVARLGGAVQFWGRVGADAAGQALLEELAAQGVDTSAVSRRGTSAVSCVIVDARGERQIISFPGAGLDSDPSQLPVAELDLCGAVMVDFRWPEGAEHLAQEARRRGVPVVADLDIGCEPVLDRMLPLADHTILSGALLEKLTRSADPAEGLRQFRDRVRGAIGVTAGAEGFHWQAPGAAPCHEPAFRVQVADTTGAGDVFHGAFTLGLAEGCDIRRAARFAAAAAAVKCRNGGGWGGMGDRASVEALLKTVAG